MVRKIHYLNLKRHLLYLRSFIKDKNDLIKFLLNLNIVVSNDEKNENNQEEIKDTK